MPAVSRLLGTGVERRALHRGRVIRRGGAELIVLHPPPPTVLQDDGLGPNDDSLVLLLRHGRVKMLFTGDLERAGEAQLLASPLARLAHGCDLLKVGHHGAPDSSGESLLELVRPRLAVVSAGRFNRFGHPAPVVLERLAHAGCRRVHLTGRHGALTVVSDGRRLYVSAFAAGCEE
jgi:competence protein ComEC